MFKLVPKTPRVSPGRFLLPFDLLNDSSHLAGALLRQEVIASMTMIPESLVDMAYVRSHNVEFRQDLTGAWFHHVVLKGKFPEYLFPGDTHAGFVAVPLCWREKTEVRGNLLRVDLSTIRAR